jgi:hypothetical protein
MAVLEGTWDVTYEPEFRIDATVSQPIGTNCLGLVCSIFDRLKIRFLAYSYPQYQDPYNRFGNRRVPPPGHLAYALWRQRRRPYRPATQAAAEEFSKAQSVLRQVLSRGLTRSMYQRISDFFKK